jgi:hypothetical protein
MIGAALPSVDHVLSLGVGSQETALCASQHMCILLESGSLKSGGRQATHYTRARLRDYTPDNRSAHAGCRAASAGRVGASMSFN